MTKVALITGAKGGIGSATALKFGKEGYKLVLNYHIKRERVDEIARSIGEDNTLLIQADITKYSEVKDMYQKAIDTFGRIDILVNNVGIIRDRTFFKMSEDEWNEVMYTNLQGAFYVTKCVLDFMIQSGKGSIVNVSSIVGRAGNYGQANYSASKAALIGMTKSLAKELADKGILVNAIAPGFVDTDMTKSIPEEVKNRIIQSIPLKRFARPEEIADAIFFLSENTYITGAVLDVNGGL